MTQDEIIEMAKTVGLFYGDKLTEDYAYKVKRFAKLVAAKEREACAKLCDSEAKQWRDAGCFDVKDFKLCASAIRARGEA